MPRVSQRPRDAEAERVDAVLGARAEFAQTFRRSARGNLWRQFDGLTVTVFKREDDRYGWCIAGPTDKRFSQSSCDDEEDALSSVASELGIGEW